MKKLFLIIFLSFSLLSSKPKSTFEIYGDVFQFMPFFAAGYALYIEDYEGLKYLTYGAGSAFLLALASKLSFVAISKKDKDLANISLRPDNSGYDGFPSGHTSFSFAGTGFLHKRYGPSFGVPAAMLSSLVGLSRIANKRHSSVQVLAGALLGFASGYFLTKELQINVDPEGIEVSILF